MSSAAPSWNDPSGPPGPLRRFTVGDYQRLGEVGILTEDDDVELLEGWITLKTVHNPPHDNAIELADEALRGRVPPGWRVRIQSVITTSDSEPEPDLAVVRGSARARAGRHPTAEEVGLVVEVADSSLETDRGVKARLYARASVSMYWVVNLRESVVEVFSNPTGPCEAPRYLDHVSLGRGAQITLRLDGESDLEIAVDELLPTG